MVKHNIQLSKKLSYLLRHRAVKKGLNITEGGYVLVSDILALPDFQQFSLEEIQEVVANNDKQRFHLKETILDSENIQYWIRANQGHTMSHVKDEALLTQIEHPHEIPICIHGTYHRAWPSILKSGLNRMKRNHIHFSIGESSDEQVISGMRHSADVHIYIDVAKAMADGIVFYRSMNNVILSSGMDGTIDKMYFEQVINNKDRSVLFKNK